MNKGDKIMSKVNVIKPAEHATVKTPWIPVPLVTKELKEKGFSGGEGCQWPLYITTSLSEPGLGFMGTDVGGMYRTLDGGKNWAMSTVGIYSSAANGICIDPFNSSRVLCVGCNSTYWDVNGIYLSTDKGESWKEVYTYRKTEDELCKLCGHRDFRHQIAFDATSYDESLGYCTVVYWNKETLKYGEGRGESHEPVLYKSYDGGETWSIANRNEYLCNMEICTSFATGYVYLAGKNGVYRSTDGAESFVKVLDKECHGIDTVPTQADNVYVCALDGMYISQDNGETFAKVDESGYPNEYPSRVRVSPANPDRMVLLNDVLSGFGRWDGRTYFSHDGGKTWAVSGRDITNSFIPYNNRQTVFAWNSADEDICISTGGDMIMRSTDGGRNFEWGGNGYNGACITSITCNLNNPRLMVTGNQDYCAAFSTDSGDTWKYLDVCGYEWGGYSYGGYSLDDNTVVLVKKMNDGKYYIAYSLDGGNTFTDTGLTPATTVVTGVYGNDDILFAGNYYTHDHCATWVEMQNCNAVFAVTESGVCYGAYDKTDIVVSSDYGKSWTKISEVPSPVRQITFDGTRDRLLIPCEDQIIYEVPTGGGEPTVFVDFTDFRDNGGYITKIRKIVVDKKNPDLMYICNALGVYASPASIFRSLDGGKSWEIINRDLNDGSVGADGARDCSSIVINSATRELFQAGGCRGMYKMKLPD